MKKMTKKDSAKIFSYANNVDPLVINYPSESGIEIKFDLNISIGDLNNIIEDARYFSNIGGVYQETLLEARIAYSIVKHLSNIPVPQIDNVDDIGLCYQLFYGEKGLIRCSERLKIFVDMIKNYCHLNVDIYKETPLDKVCNKVLSLYDIYSSQLKSMNDNPTEVLNIIEHLGMEV